MTDRIRSIAVAAALALACLSGSARASAGAGRFDCVDRLQPLLNSPIASLRGDDPVWPYPQDRIKSSKPLISELSEDYRMLSAEMETDLFGLTSDERKVCRGLAARMRGQLESFFERHLAYDLTVGPRAFFVDLGRLLAPWPSRAERGRIRARFDQAISGYLWLVLDELQSSLRVEPSSRWARYADVRPAALEQWSDDWNRILGASAPGAVLYESKRVALQASEIDPETLEVVLFHELVHLADSRTQDAALRARLSDEDAELLAWDETLDYLSWRENAGIETPEYFERARAAIGTIQVVPGQVPPGSDQARERLKIWVRAVVRSREPVTPPASAPRARSS